ncbi:fungal specific transcription factor [Curvularia clavata]|uniref:Fungal specific transcription factor n=1 Tax=Curvularia clavata TaxID=95742 RepID=A0A9Q9DP73_CURCL|nr:fungal specific transcription factor [Curvularia clavata]
MATTPADKANMGDAMSPPNDSGNNAKRKSDDAPTQPRAKRNRYISIACNECKRRKIKCNGQTPCQRCGNLNLDCQYAPNCCNNFKESEEFKQMSAHISSLQQQVDDLFHNINSLRSQVDVQSNGSMETPFTQDYQQTPMMPQPTRSRSKSFSKHPRFHGPTSNAFNVGVARSSLKTMGINPGEEAEDDGLLTRDGTPGASPPAPNGMLPKRSFHVEKDPIWAISKHDALRLVHVWHEEMGVMYPILDIDKVLRYTEMLFTFVEAAARSGLVQGAFPGSDAMMDEQISILKLVLAITLVLEGGGKDPLGEKLFTNVHKVVNKTLSEPVNLHNINLLVLTAMYHFTRDDEGLAWRVSGLASRHCLELGLHRRDTYATLFPNPEDQAVAIRTFWTIYVLDRRWSFGTGMPFALQDADIDSNLPKPIQDASSHESSPYLNAMISYSIIGSKVWRSVADVGQDKINKEDISFLDFQVLNWHRSIPDSLKFVHPDSGRQIEPPARVIHRLQVVLYLRANQMRILIYRPVLHTASTIMDNLDFAHVVVKVAKDTIRILTFLNQTSDIYRSQQTMFNYFLISALAVLFLAVAHAPAEFSQQSRDEFYMALDLVRGLSVNSYVSKRLWRTIKTMKEVGPRLGLVIRQDDTHDAHSSAAVAMAGLAGHSMDELALFPHGRNGNILDTAQGMASDLTTLFEAAGGIFNLPGFGGSSSEMSNANGEFVNGFGPENDELARIMRDLF